MSPPTLRAKALISATLASRTPLAMLSRSPCARGQPQRRRGCVARPDQGRRRGRGSWPVRPQPDQGAGRFPRARLAPFGRSDQTALAGSAKGTLDLSGDPAEGQIDANIAITADKLETGVEAVDRIDRRDGENRSDGRQNEGWLPLRRPEPRDRQFDREYRRQRLTHGGRRAFRRRGRRSRARFQRILPARRRPMAI